MQGISKKGKVEGTSPPQGGSPPLRAADHEGSGSDSDPLELLAETSDTETTCLMMEYFPQHCDSASLSSFSLDTPSLPRHPPPQDDTASLVSTGTLVPEAIYLPPPGHRLVTHSDWDKLQAQVSIRLVFLAGFSQPLKTVPGNFKIVVARPEKVMKILKNTNK